MKLERDLVFLDTETTGIDPVTDRIVELGVCVCSTSPENNREWSSRFNPEIPIPAAAAAVHGITDADVADKPLFRDWAPKILRSIAGKDLAGYNIWRFDLPILDEEFRRCGLKLDLTGVHVVDAFGIFAKREPRDLTAAVAKYCGRKHEGAHGALMDAIATGYVLEGQLKAYPDLADMSVAELARYAYPDERKYLDLARKIFIDDDGDACFTFGKHMNDKVRRHRDYAEWMLKQNFPGSTLEALRTELARVESAMFSPIVDRR